MNTEITVPYWFDVWYRNIDAEGFGERNNIAIKKITNQGWGSTFTQKLWDNQRPDVLPVGLDTLELQEYVGKHRLELIEAVIHGYVVEDEEE